MTTALPDELQAIQEIFGQIPAHDFRPDVGYAVGIVARLAREFSGDPTKYFSVTSANFSSPASLPDDPRAKSAILQVINTPCFYRVDGTNPAIASEQTLPIGTVIKLTGMPSIKGFIFTSVSITPSIIAVTYFD